MSGCPNLGHTTLVTTLQKPDSRTMVNILQAGDQNTRLQCRQSRAGIHRRICTHCTVGCPPKKYKKNFADFRKFYYTTFLVNLHHFSYFDPTKIPRFFFIILSGIPCWLRSVEKICACAQCIFWFWFLSIARSNSWRNRK